MKYDYKTIFDNIVRNVNEYLTNKNELIIENSNEKETYISCIKIINLLEVLKKKQMRHLVFIVIKLLMN